MPAGASATLTVTATGSDLTYQWKKNGSNVSGATSAAYSIASTAVADAGSYTCEVTSPSGSALSDTAMLTVLTSDGSIADAKALADGSSVQLGNKDLYLKWPAFAYIEEPSLFSGIRVQGALTASTGDRICVTGTMQKPAGAEPYIQVTAMIPSGAANVPADCWMDSTLWRSEES